MDSFVVIEILMFYFYSGFKYIFFTFKHTPYLFCCSLDIETFKSKWNEHFISIPICVNVDFCAELYVTVTL